MNSIITYLLIQNQYLLQIISYLCNFICKFIPLKQFIFDDSNSPDYQKFKTDKLPVIKKFEKHDFRFLLAYYQWKYGKTLKPINRRNDKTIPETVVCPRCGATHHYIYDNNGGKGEYLCKVCSLTFDSGKKVSKPLVLICPYCGHALVPKKTASILLFINALTRNAHIIFKILKRLKRKI